MAELPAEVRELFERRNFAHLATALPDGSPHSVPVWMCLEDDNPYRSAWVRGRVVDRIDGEVSPLCSWAPALSPVHAT